MQNLLLVVIGVVILILSGMILFTNENIKNMFLSTNESESVEKLATSTAMEVATDNLGESIEMDDTSATEEAESKSVDQNIEVKTEVSEKNVEITESLDLQEGKSTVVNDIDLLVVNQNISLGDAITVIWDPSKIPSGADGIGLHIVRPDGNYVSGTGVVGIDPQLGLYTLQKLPEEPFSGFVDGESYFVSALVTETRNPNSNILVAARSDFFEIVSNNEQKISDGSAAGSNQEPESISESIKEYKIVGLDYWSAFSKANIDSLYKYYATEVIILAGSELLDNDYGVAPIDKYNQTLNLKRKDVIDGYSHMIDLIGIDDWKDTFMTEINIDDFVFYSVDDPSLMNSQWYEEIKNINLSSNNSVVMSYETDKYDNDPSDGSIYIPEPILFILEQTAEGIRITVELSKY